MKKHQTLPFLKPVPDTGRIFTVDFGDGAVLPNVSLASCFISIPTCTETFDTYAHDPLCYRLPIHDYPDHRPVQTGQIGGHKYALRYDKVFWGIRGRNYAGPEFFFDTEEKCRRFRDEKQYDGIVAPYFCVNPSFPLFYKEVFDFCIGACGAQIPNADEAESRSERNGYLAAIKDCIDAIRMAQQLGAMRE